MTIIEKKLIEIIQSEAANNNIILPKIISQENNIIDDLGFDSIAVLQLLLRIEDEFNIEIDDEYITPELFISLKKLSNFSEGVCN